MNEPLVVAVDWSGRQRGERNHLWFGLARSGRLEELFCGLARAEVAPFLEELARDERLIAGFDFAFSMPSWFLSERGLESAFELWDVVAVEGDAWLADCEPPFWGRPGRRRPLGLDGLRATDHDVLPVGGIRPKSVFQVGGAGAVGTASLRGMPVLAELRRRGFKVWPFETPTLPFVLEIYPRALTGSVRKSNGAARRSYLDALEWARVPPSLRRRAVDSEDAFDAGVSALAMSRHTDELLSLGAARHGRTSLEGAIWVPAGLRELTVG